jgi:Cu2+-exporting ATPase
MSIAPILPASGGVLEPPAQTTRSKKPVCRHCGAALIDDRMRETGFCCSGCAYVFRLVHEHGLAGYYDLKDAITVPADAAVFQARDYGWLEAAQQQADAAASAGPAPARPPELTLDVQGISCAGCVWLIERLFQQQAGARDIFVNAQLGSMRLRWLPGEFSARDFAQKLQAFGYLAGPSDPGRSEPESRGLVKRVGLCAAFAMNIMLFTLPSYFGMEKTFQYAGLFGLLSLGFATISFMVGGSYFLGRAWQATRMGVMHIDMPIAIGILGAYLGSLYGWFTGQDRFVYFDFVGTFILLMLVGRWAQVSAVERNRRRLLGQQARPHKVRVICGAGGPASIVREVQPEQLRVGETLILASGQTLPVDARLTAAETVFSLASINGEAEPRSFRSGQRVPAGAVNLGRADAVLEVLQPWSASLLAQLLEAGERSGYRHVFLERIVKGYLIGILILAVASGAGWWIKTGDGPRTWSVVTAVLVVSCPCAIGLAFPLADEMATTALRRRGVFVRENDLWSKLGGVRKLVFDKTGTLTLETPVLTNPEALGGLDAAARSALLAMVRDSEHPVSQCLCENLLALGPVEWNPGKVTETVGFGLELEAWSLGRAGWQDGQRGSGGTTDLVHRGQVVARFQFVDAARPDARAEIAALQRDGFSVYILSGDSRAKVEKLAAELAIPAAHALGELTPSQKADWLGHEGASDALMLGDGANDSLAFDRALCRGTPVVHRGVLEKKADFYYLGRGIGGIRELFGVDAVRRRTQWIILVFSVLYNVLAVGLAVAGRMNPLVAAILMPANSIVTLALVSGGMRRAVFGPALRNT